MAPVFELTVIGVFEPGVPNKERIILRPTQAIDLSQFGLLVSLHTDQGFVPITDAFFWMGAKVVAPPSWIVIFTDSGEYLETKHEETGEPVYIAHWGRAYTMFGNSLLKLAVGVVRIGGFASWLVPPPAAPPALLLDPTRKQ